MFFSRCLTLFGHLIEHNHPMMKISRNRSRRRFLRDLSLNAVAIAWRGFDFAEYAKAQTPSSQKKLGVALLGLGRYSTNELAVLLSNKRACAGWPGWSSAVTRKKLQQWAKQYDLPEKNLYNYDNFDRIIDNPDIDIVYVVTPPALHPGFAIRAAKAGKHVISEKPMATSVADCQAMIDACKKANVKLSLGYRMHFDPHMASN